MKKSTKLFLITLQLTFIVVFLSLAIYNIFINNIFLSFISVLFTLISSFYQIIGKKFKELSNLIDPTNKLIKAKEKNNKDFILKEKFIQPILKVDKKYIKRIENKIKYGDNQKKNLNEKEEFVYFNFS